MIEYCMQAAICDDDPKDLQAIAAMAQEIARQKGIACEFTLYESSAALLRAIQGGAQFHLLVLDVMMDELGGMELASLLRSQGNKTAIVFFSSNRELTLQGYEVSAVRYLAKPIDPEKLAEALLVCYRAGQEILGCRDS